MLIPAVVNMNPLRTPSQTRTRQKVQASPCTSVPRDRFIMRADPSVPQSESPRPLISQETETRLPGISQPPATLTLLKVIEAPSVENDYHLSLIAWSDRDVLVVALRSNLCLYSLHSGAVSEIPSRQTLTSVATRPGTPTVAVGTDRAGIRLYDIGTSKKVGEITAHKDRVAILAWSGDVLFSGSKDCSVHFTDTRTKDRGSVLRAHTGEVCSLALNQLNSSELASGGADNCVLLWDLRNRQMRSQGQHRACVKALVWCPWKSDRLTSGGGYADCCIKEWSTTSALACLQEMHAGAQISSFLWDRWDRQLISGHGYPSCSLAVWKGTTKAEEYAHGGRVLGMAAAPLGDQMASLAADETVRLWHLGAFSSSEEESLSSRSRRYVLAR